MSKVRFIAEVDTADLARLPQSDDPENQLRDAITDGLIDGFKTEYVEVKDIVEEGEAAWLTSYRF